MQVVDRLGQSLVFPSVDLRPPGSGLHPRHGHDLDALAEKVVDCLAESARRDMVPFRRDDPEMVRFGTGVVRIDTCEHGIGELDRAKRIVAAQLLVRRRREVFLRGDDDQHPGAPQEAVDPLQRVFIPPLEDGRCFVLRLLLVVVGVEVGGGERRMHRLHKRLRRLAPVGDRDVVRHVARGAVGFEPADAALAEAPIHVRRQVTRTEIVDDEIGPGLLVAGEAEVAEGRIEAEAGRRALLPVWLGRAEEQFAEPSCIGQFFRAQHLDEDPPGEVGLRPAAVEGGAHGMGPLDAEDDHVCGLAIGPTGICERPKGPLPRDLDAFLPEASGSIDGQIMVHRLPEL